MSNNDLSNKSLYNSFHCSHMRISDRLRTDFDKAKSKLTGHFDFRPISRCFQPTAQTA